VSDPLSTIFDIIRGLVVEATTGGAIPFFDPLHSLTVLDQILDHFQNEEDSEDLRLFLVIEEAHLWTAKGVPREAADFLDRVVRLLRKKGVGVMLVSHKISDFDPAMRSSMNVSIIFRTKYEGDLDSLSRILGSEFSKIVRSLPVGYSILHSADLGSPFAVAWRRLYSRP